MLTTAHSTTAGSQGRENNTHLTTTPPPPSTHTPSTTTTTTTTMHARVACPTCQPLVRGPHAHPVLRQEPVNKGVILQHLGQPRGDGGGGSSKVGTEMMIVMVA